MKAIRNNIQPTDPWPDRLLPFECSDTRRAWPRILHVKKIAPPIHSYSMFHFLQQVNIFVKLFEKEAFVPSFDMIMSVDGEPNLLAYFGPREPDVSKGNLEVA